MANELKIKASIAYNPSTDGIVGTETGLREILVDMTGADFTQGTQEIGNSEEQIVVSADIGTQGWWFVTNIDEDQIVTLGPTGTEAITLNPGEFALFRTNAALYATADANTAVINFYCFET